MTRAATQFLLTFLSAAVPAAPAFAQSESLKKAVEGIVGDSDIRQEQAKTSDDEQKILSAIDNTVENTGMVRKLSDAKHVEIVFLPDSARAEGGPPPRIESKLKDHADDIAKLRQEVEANALLFHAVASKRVQTRDIIAVEFPEPTSVIVYAAAKPTD